MTGPTHHTGATTAPPGPGPAATRRDRQRAGRAAWQQQHLDRALAGYRADFDHTVQQLARRARRWRSCRAPKRAAP